MSAKGSSKGPMVKSGQQVEQKNADISVTD